MHVGAWQREVDKTSHACLALDSLSLLKAKTCMHAAQAIPQCPELQESVARLGQAWWGADAPGKEALVAQALPYLILRALTTGAHSAGTALWAPCMHARRQGAYWRAGVFSG